MATSTPPNQAKSSRADTFSKRVEHFWARVTEGMQISELWSQFRTDARSSYRLYSKDVDSTRVAGESRVRHALNIVGRFFWAIIEKLTPARRVLLLIALVLIIIPSGDATWQSRSGEVKVVGFDTHFYGGLLMFALLILEVGDRVVMKRDLQIAKEIQTWLLPATPPQVPGMEIAFTTKPANTVAGDYYDVFPRPHGGPDGQDYLMAIADVAGKSIPAAMLMATFQASLKTLSITPGALIELVGRMNRYACTNSQDGRRFTTAWIAEYDPATRLLTYVNAGHNNPILRRKTGAMERLEAGGMPLGIMDEAPYVSATVTLESGDWLAVFTDGVVEAENNNQEEYGEIRFMTMINAGVMLSPEMMLNSIMVDLDRFTGDAAQHDDITCMLLKAV
jgi:sigma-B regulation protein RsbU (phosphoserine phosphatase)